MDKINLNLSCVFKNYLIMYTNGACEGNASTTKQSYRGVGIYFGPNCMHSKSVQFPKSIKRLNNNVSEIFSDVYA
mgnify:CR=1 FL=1